MTSDKLFQCDSMEAEQDARTEVEGDRKIDERRVGKKTDVQWGQSKRHGGGREIVLCS